MSQLQVVGPARAPSTEISWKDVKVGEVVRRQGIADSFYMKLSTGGGLHFNTYAGATQGQYLSKKILSYMRFSVVKTARLEIGD